MAIPSEISFDADGLISCILQDRRSGAVLTLAYMNRESLERTIATGDIWFYSRSRQELWHKGETSGNYQRLTELRYDCDGDSLLAIVDPVGPACHTGEPTCFYRSTSATPETADFEAPARLQATLDRRRAQMPAGSYTTELLSHPTLAGEKVQEEAEEVVRAEREETDQRLCEEAADVLYHLAVLMARRGLGLSDAFGVLNRRAGAAKS